MTSSTYKFASNQNRMEHIRESLLGTTPKSKHFRISGIPFHCSIDDLKEALKVRYNLAARDAITVFSLAPFVDLEHGYQSLVGILSCHEIYHSIFLDNPQSIEREECHVSLSFPTHTSKHEVMLDTHFLGLTPWSSNPLGHDTVDFIAIHGVGGSAYASWISGDYMWLRDSLAKYPQARVWTFGYHSKLNSNRSTSVPPIASDLRSLLLMKRKREQEIGQYNPAMIFICHSLGGIIFREMLLQDLRAEDTTKALLYGTYGAVMFGPPFGGWYNRELANNVAHNSMRHTLLELDPILSYETGERDRREFEKVFNFAGSEIFTFVESLESPIYKLSPETRKLEKTGKTVLLVSPESATFGSRDQDKYRTKSLNLDHSGLVKFDKDSTEHKIVINVLRGMLAKAPESIRTRQRQYIWDSLESDRVDTIQLLELLSFLDGRSISIPMLKSSFAAFHKAESTITQLQHSVVHRSYQTGIPRNIAQTIIGNTSLQDTLYELTSMFLSHSEQCSSTLIMSYEYQTIIRERMKMRPKAFALSFEMVVKALHFSLQQEHGISVAGCFHHIERLRMIWRESTVYLLNLTTSKEMLASLFHRAGKTLQEQDDFITSRQLFEEAKSLYSTCLGEKHASTLSAYTSLAGAYHMMGEYRKAEVAFIDICCLGEKRTFKVLGRDAIGARRNLADFYFYNGQVQEARIQMLTVQKRLKARKDPAVVIDEQMRSEALFEEITKFLDQTAVEQYTDQHGDSASRTLMTKLKQYSMLCL